MFIETLALENFKCFGPGRTSIDLDSNLTAFIGTNGTGKTAACEALLWLFGITGQDRAVRAEDFHVPVDETEAPSSRELTIEAVLALPELDEDNQGDDDEDSDEDAAGQDDEAQDDEAQDTTMTSATTTKTRTAKFSTRTGTATPRNNGWSAAGWFAGRTRSSTTSRDTSSPRSRSSRSGSCATASGARRTDHDGSLVGRGIFIRRECVHGRQHLRQPAQPTSARRPRV